MKGTLILIFLITPLVLGWTLNLNSFIEDLCFLDDGTLAVVTHDGHFYLIGFSGNIIMNATLNKEVPSAVRCYQNTIYVATLNGTVYSIASGKINSQVKLNFTIDGLGVNANGVMACGEGYCAYLTKELKLVWKKKIVGYVIGDFALTDEYSYIPDIENDSIIIVNVTTGNIVNTVYLGEDLYYTRICGKTLVVTSRYHIRAFEVNGAMLSLKWIKDIGGWGVAIRSDCNEIMVTNPAGKIIVVLDGYGNQERIIPLLGYPYAIDLWGFVWERVAVGLNDGRLICDEPSKIGVKMSVNLMIMISSVFFSISIMRRKS